MNKNTNTNTELLYTTSENNSFDVEDTSSESSCSSCCDFHSSDSAPEWDSSVQNNGELFFLKCSPVINKYISSHNSSIQYNITCSKQKKFQTFLNKRKLKKKKNDCKIDTNEEFYIDSQVNNNVVDSSLILVLNLQNVEPTNSTSVENVHYCFPQATDKNLIYLINGALLTLYHSLPTLTVEKPESVTILIRNELVNLVYLSEGDELMILAFPENRCSLFQLKQVIIVLKRYINLKYRSLHDCFTSSINHTKLNQFFEFLFYKLLKKNESLYFMRNLTAAAIHDTANIQFEDTFFSPSLLIVPRYLKMKIDKKLNEIEANDFGDLSEDHYGYQRLYVIIGSCLYHKGYLIASHLQRNEQLDVHCFLRFNDLLDLTVTTKIESLVIWQEIFLFSYDNNSKKSASSTAKKRWFLLIVGQDQSLLVTILESGDYCTKKADVTRPDELYIEQIQEALNDILQYGLAYSVNQIIRQLKSDTTNSQPRSSIPKLSKYFLSNLNNSVANSGKKFSESDSTANSNLIDSLSDSPFTFDNTIDNTSYSESLSRTTSSAFSNESAPVLGRRAQRLGNNNISDNIYSQNHCNLSDFDRFGNCTATGINVNKIIHGEKNLLFYYVNLNSAKGIVIDSLNNFNAESSKKYNSILNNFKLSVERIHTVFSQNKTLVAEKCQTNSIFIKEYGILFEFVNENETKEPPLLYWTVGRVFNKSHLGEIYVCYEDKIPQNLVEIAFRLSISSL